MNIVIVLVNCYSTSVACKHNGLGLGSGLVDQVVDWSCLSLGQHGLIDNISDFNMATRRHNMSLCFTCFYVQRVSIACYAEKR